MTFQVGLLIYVIIGVMTAHDVMYHTLKLREECLPAFMATVLLLVASWPALWIVRGIVGVMRRWPR